MKYGPSLAVRFTLYPLVGLLFAIIAIYIIFFAAGYDISFQDGRLVTKKTGIIIIKTVPGEATVYLDNEEYSRKTPNIGFFDLKLNRVSTGEHSVKVERDGYIPWENTVTVEPGYVTWLDYLYLIPLEKEAEPYKLSGSVSSQITSFDKSKVLVSSIDAVEKVGTLWQLNPNNKDTQKIYEYDTSVAKVDPLSYSNDNERYLTKETENKKTSYIVREARDGGNSWNISNLFNIQIDDIIFSPYTHNELYVTRENSLYKMNLLERTLSATLAKDVYGVYESENGLLLVQKSSDNYGLYKIHQNGNKDTLIKSFPASKNYNVSYLSESKSYVIHNLDDKELYLYSNEVKNPTIETIAKDVSYFKVSPVEERILYKASKKTQVYDIKKAEYYEITTSTDFGQMSWLSGGDNIIYHTGTEVRMVNYNGVYDNPLFESTSPILTLAAKDEPNIYFISTLAKNDLDLFVFSF
ncbi:MAG: PEGA domain-containing protein [Patescibacteria group bacterium]|nr:PEGA domain-containing protein [Patescibacteria group bacterium]